MLKTYQLVGDISATNSTLGVIENSKIVHIKKFKTKEYVSLEEMLKNYLKDINYFKISKAAFGVAGPVNKTFLTLSQNKIKINRTRIKKLLDTQRVFFINDFVALAHSIESLKSSEVLTINKGKKSGLNMALVGAGTGFGTACFFPKNNFYQIRSSEFWYHQLNVEKEDEIELFNFVKTWRHLRKVWIQSLVSGNGLETIYRFYQQFEFNNSPKNLTAKEISRTKKTNECSKKTFEMFFRFYARACRVVCEKKLAYGGIYIAGGIIQKNLDFNKKAFLQEFQKSQKLKETPIQILKDYFKSLEGLKNYLEKK